MVHEEKARICQIPNETLEFLVYTLGRGYSPSGELRLDERSYPSAEC